MSQPESLPEILPGEAMLSIFSPTTNLFHLAYCSFYDLHCEMLFPAVLNELPGVAD